MFVQRHFQKLGKRSADSQHVHVLLKEFEDADQLLGKVIDASKAWREAWIAILTYQNRMLNEYDLLYAPIIGAGEDYQGHVPVETPEHLVARTNRLRTEYEDLKRDLTEELDQVNVRMIQPAQDARDSLSTAKKVIKKREDKKLDFERYQSRVDSGVKKSKPNDRERSQLEKARNDLAVATDVYNAADDHLRGYLPPLLTAIWSLQPYLLEAQIQIQNSLLAHYYTMLHTYCQEEGFPSPAPAMDEVIRTWSDSFKSIQKEMESQNIIAHGKAIRKSFSKEERPVNGYGRRASQPSSRGPSLSPARPPMPPSPNFDGANGIAIPLTRPKTSHSLSSNSLLSPTPEPFPGSLSQSPSSSLYATPMAVSPAGPHVDYFSRERQPSSTSTYSNGGHTPITPVTTPGGTVHSHLAALAAKKRPPPPPPPPRAPSDRSVYVVALYDFDGQGDGDLVFREGDRIRVIKKTESVDDWWQGELKGVKGLFPANYVQV